MKQPNKMICPKCGSENTKKHGVISGTQRFKCKNCNKTFLETRKRIKYNSKEKAFLSMLWNFLNAAIQEQELDIHNTIENINENDESTNNFRLIQQTSLSESEIACYSPKLLICAEFNTVTMYRIHPRTNKKSTSRVIKILDDDEYSRFKKVIIEKIQKDKRNKSKNLSPHEIISIRQRNK